LKWLKEKEKSKELSALKKLKEEGGGVDHHYWQDESLEL
jgi:hypothetical protein